MAHFPVDLSRVQPKNQGIAVPMVLRTMPRAPGNAKASVPVVQHNATPKPVVAGVSRAAAQHPAIEELRVPASSEYVEPPMRVTGSAQRAPSVP